MEVWERRGGEVRWPSLGRCGGGGGVGGGSLSVGKNLAVVSWQCGLASFG
eukprot:COSAG02_NODE_67904_length_252_cov_0.483660_1_plen_49_part_01